LSLLLPTSALAASWTQHYTLGPGDVLDLSLFGRPDLTRVDLFIEPDGNISYLQATGIHAEGLTVDELRAKIEQSLSTYYKRPRVMIAPKELHSKKYFILGKVESAGAYPMDHPVTLVEAIAQAKGVELGLVEDKTVELCDYSHSFLLRHGRHMPVDFQRLFVDGDTSQNVILEPNDYIYMASAISNNFFVLGQINNPGSQGYTPNLTVTDAIALRGGFTQLAYRDRVLILRGSIEHPQHFVVDINKTLRGLQPDFHLEPKDVIYINARPWQFAEELLDTAISAFTTAATTTWTSYSLPALLSRPIFPALRQ
jgi:protein involved in polysaccharide export with SLBB domain